MNLHSVALPIHILYSYPPKEHKMADSGVALDSIILDMYVIQSPVFAGRLPLLCCSILASSSSQIESRIYIAGLGEYFSASRTAPIC